MERKSSLICYSHYGYSRYPSIILKLHMEQLTLWEEIISGILKSDNDHEAVVEKALKILLASDGFLSCYQFFSEEMKGKERFFIRNSILGFVSFLKEKN